MPFDTDTRNKLARMVADARTILRTEFTSQLQEIYSIQPDGNITDIEKLSHLDDEQRDVARLLRERVAHLASSMENKKKPISAAIDRMTREQSFTLLNRFAALRMCEERKLIQQCVGAGMDSEGFAVYLQVAGTGLGDRYERYCSFIFCVFDEIAIDLGILFDRFSPFGLLFPRESALEKLLGVINQSELKYIWVEDEAIGWIYQYFNTPEERKAMRNASQAPRNSRELAVRNQFFTPRYVVEFLTDNTLGRIWYEMRKGNTAFKKVCRYLVRRPNEIFLKPGEKIQGIEEDENAQRYICLSQEELLKKPVYILHRPVKDPRNLKMLDPACGSMHFGLYAFDLFEIIYREAWEMEKQLGAHALIRSEDLKSLHETYEDKGAFLSDVPRLIIEHNIHGIDIDPRAVQIAALALWLRAQRSWRNLAVKVEERPRIKKSNIVTAEPMPGDEDMRLEFTAGLKPRVLGQLVDVVFDKMKLAGEAGSLLKIEGEIKDAIAIAKKQWEKGPKPEQQILFTGMTDPRPRQQELLFDFKGVSDERFWERAEDRILDELREYAERAENGYAVLRRLFTEDAERGFAFIDLCRKRYDVVLMNPPFGEFSKAHKAQARNDYPNSYNDILAAFTERWYWRLTEGGSLGAITSRVGFFLASFKKWRSAFLLRNRCISALVDLGEAVMDEAMVESAAYVLRGKRAEKETVVIRLLGKEARAEKLCSAIGTICKGIASRLLFFVDLQSCASLPNAPIVYWIDPAIVTTLAKHPHFEPTIGEVRCGLSTGDNFRFIRLLWEVPEHDIQNRWFPLVMTGASQPWFSPLLVVVDWKNEGYYLAQYEGSTIRGREFYFRPGFSWTRRAVRFVPYGIPAGCIPSASRYQAYPSKGNEFVGLALTASNVVSALLRFYGEKFKWPNFLVDNVKGLPWPIISKELRRTLIATVQSEVNLRRRAYQNVEPFQEFVAPSNFFNGTAHDVLMWNLASILGEDVDIEIALAYGFSRSAYDTLTRDLREAIAAVTPSGRHDEKIDETSQSDEEVADAVVSEDDRAKQEAIVSYLVGIVYSRWDVRIAMDPTLAPKLPNPFDPLPVCPPGMLVGQDGLPAETNRIVSEEWLRARPNANTLPPEGSVKNPTIPYSDYPIQISLSGILVDDPGFEIGEPHRDDIVRRVRETLDLFWKDKAHEIEQEACEILGVTDLRDYLRKPTGFFQDHLKRYSKSRRKAPIYWPLSSESGSYTLWIYYHRLTDQSLFTCVNDYLKPKIDEVSRDIERLQKDLDTAGNANKRSQLEKLQDFRQELIDLRDELLQVSNLPYKPNLNDGVLISAAPLWKLFRHKPWQKELKACWKKLESGEYDWAHLAHSIWPDRVKKLCKTDRSIAIAHDLEHLCEIEVKAPKNKKGRKKQGS